MFKNYLLVALRNLSRNKSYIIINTFGLGIALACCIAAYLLLAFNIEFEDYHADDKVKDVYRLHSHLTELDGKAYQTAMAPSVLPVYAAEEIAGIEQYTRYISWNAIMRHENNPFSESIHFTDSTFFDIFDFTFVHGSPNSFKDKHTIIIDEELSKKYFGDADPIGKQLTVTFASNKEVEVIVGGVVGKIPRNSSFTFTAMMRMEHFMNVNDVAIDNWGDWRDPSTFFKLSPAADPQAVAKQMSKYVPIRREAKKDQLLTHFTLEQFKSKFTYDDVRGTYANMRGSFVPLMVFTSLAAMILLIACFNLTNTSIALTTKRLKEVGVRKAVGAMRGQIIVQFLFETSITIMLSLIVGLGMSQIIVPAFSTMWGLGYTLEDLNGINLFIAMMFLVFIASLVAGMYPALFNSGFKPVSLLKGSVKVHGTNTLTHTLVALQFAISVMVLVGGVMFIRNTKFQEKIDFGFDSDKVVMVNIQAENEYVAMRNAIQRNPKIHNVAASDHNAGYSNYQFPVRIDTTEYTSQHMAVGNNYMETMGFTFVEGRSFNLENKQDMEEAVIVNEAFLEKVGINDPLDKVITIHEKKRHIIGVVKNHVDNLFRSREPEPFIFYPAEPSWYKVMVVNADEENLADVQKYLEKTWKDLFPTKPFLSMFQKDIQLQDMKRTNGNLEKVFLFLTILGALLSASGIYALASLNIAKRTKEIGIRKALGASVSNVVTLLNREFIVVLSIAVLLGGVGGFYFTTFLLKEIYAYHIVVTFVPVSLCAVGLFVVGILTTSSTILKAAKSNPVDTLRSE